MSLPPGVTLWKYDDAHEEMKRLLLAGIPFWAKPTEDGVLLEEWPAYRDPPGGG